MRANGFSLIEVMVSLLILSIGLLGMIGLQLAGMRSTQNAYYRSQATLLVSDMTERMRSNLPGVQAGAYVAADPELNAECFTVSGCSSDSLAAQDLAEWKAAVARILPSGAGTVRSVVPPGEGMQGYHRVLVQWDGNRDGTAGQHYASAFIGE